MEEKPDCWNQKDRCGGCPIDDPGRTCSYFAMNYQKFNSLGEGAKNTEQADQPCAK